MNEGKLNNLFIFSPGQILSKSYTPEKKNAIKTPITKPIKGVALTASTWNQFVNGFPDRPNVNKGIDNLSMVYNQMLYQTAINDVEKNKEDILSKNRLLYVENLNKDIFKRNLIYILYPIIILLIISFIIIYIIKYDKDIVIAKSISLFMTWIIFYGIIIIPYFNSIIDNEKLFNIYMANSINELNY